MTSGTHFVSREFDVWLDVIKCKQFLKQSFTCCKHGH